MKTKGSNAERELVAMFWEYGWGALRIAGSGRMNYPCPDVLAGNGSRIVAVECKSTKSDYQYISSEQIKQLIDFAALFNAETWVGVKFSAKWNFFNPKELELTKKGFYVIHKDKHKGRDFLEVISSNDIEDQ